MSPVAVALISLAEKAIEAEGPALVAALSKLLSGQKAAPPTLAQQEALASLAADAQARAELGG